jgi:hypothetical protein
MARLYPIPYGNGVVLVPDFMNPTRDERIVKPTRRKGIRHA